MRPCPRHGETVFHLYRKNGPKPYYKCKRCVGEAVTRRHRKLRAILVEEAGGRCVVCGYRRCSFNLHFHHVDPARKSVEMTVARGLSIAAYRAEALKCVLVCANCHGEIESGLVRSPQPGSRYSDRKEAA